MTALKWKRRWVEMGRKKNELAKSKRKWERKRKIVRLGLCFIFIFIIFYADEERRQEIIYKLISYFC